MRKDKIKLHVKYKWFCTKCGKSANTIQTKHRATVNGRSHVKRKHPKEYEAGLEANVRAVR